MRTLINPRDRVRIGGHPDEYIVYTVSRHGSGEVCVTHDNSRKWFPARDVTLVGVADPIDWKAGDRFAWRSGNGQVVRHGTLLKLEDNGNWFLRVDAEPHPSGYDMEGYETWLPTEWLVPIDEEN